MYSDEGLSVFEELFSYACPKFIAATGRLDAVNKQRVDPHQNQLKIFKSDISNQIMLPTLRSFMKLYTSMGIDKLAKFLEIDAEELKAHLLVFKQKSRQYKWVSGDLLEGEYLPTSDLDFCLKQDVVHIAESKVGRRYGDWFLRNINRCEDIVANLEQK